MCVNIEVNILSLLFSILSIPLFYTKWMTLSYDVKTYSLLWAPIDLWIVFTKCIFNFQAKEFGRKAVVASDNNPDENFSRNIVEFMKICERVK